MNVLMESAVNRKPKTPGVQILRRGPNPVHMSEDEADGIIATRRKIEPTISFEQYLRDHGYEMDQNRKG